MLALVALDEAAEEDVGSELEETSSLELVSLAEVLLDGADDELEADVDVEIGVMDDDVRAPEVDVAEDCTDADDTELTGVDDATEVEEDVDEAESVVDVVSSAGAGIA